MIFREMAQQWILGQGPTWGLARMARVSREAGGKDGVWARQANYAVNLVVEGEGRYRSGPGRAERRLEAGSLYQHVPGDRGAEVDWEPGRVSEWYVMLDAGTAERFGAFGLFPARRLLRHPSVPTALDLADGTLQRLQDVGHSPLPTDCCRVVAELMSLLAELFRAARPEAASGDRHREAVRRVRRWMERFPEDRRPLADLAKEAGMSYATLRKSFRETTGMSLNDYRILCRVHRAQRLLLDHNAQETSDRLGYSDPFVFSSQFRQRTGMSPSAYRKRIR